MAVSHAMLTAPSYSFQAPATSRDISTTAEFIRAWLPELGWLNWNYLGSLMTGYARNPSPKYQLISYVILSFALSEAMGLFCLMVTSHLLQSMKQIFPPLPSTVLPPMSPLPCMFFFLYFLRKPGKVKWLAQSLREGRLINILY